MTVQVPPYELLRRYWDVYVWLVRQLRTLDGLFPQAQLTSWFRARAHNASVGGAEFSQHRLGFALDVALPEEDLHRFAGVADSLGFITVVYPTHVHLQIFPPQLLPPSLFTI